MSETKLEINPVLIEKDPEIGVSHYAPLNVIAHDSYVNYETENGVIMQYRGRIYSSKTIHANGATELILCQEYRNGKLENWQPFLFRTKDPNISAISLFDLVPRSQVDPAANKRITNLGYGISWTLIGILVYIIAADVQIDMTLTFFGMILGFALAIASTFYYEMKRMREDLVHVATFFQDAPNIAIYRSFTHPINGEVMRFFGEVPPIQIKSSKITFQKIRGYSVQQMAERLKYAKDIENFRKQKYLLEIQKHNLQHSNGNLSKDEKEKLITQLENLEQEIQTEKNRILKKHGDYATSGQLNDILEAVELEMQDGEFRRKIEEQLESERAEVDDLHTKISQLEIERDKYEKESQSWMKAANRDVNQFNIVVAAKLSKILKEGSLVDVYSPGSESKSAINPVNTNLASALAGFFPFLLIFAIGMFLFNTIKQSLQQMGEWASFLYVLFVTVMSIAIAIFAFTYTKSRLRDIAHNQTNSQKVVMQ